MLQFCIIVVCVTFQMFVCSVLQRNICGFSSKQTGREGESVCVWERVLEFCCWQYAVSVLYMKELQLSNDSFTALYFKSYIKCIIKFSYLGIFLFLSLQVPMCSFRNVLIIFCFSFLFIGMELKLNFNLESSHNTLSERNKAKKKKNQIYV